MKRVLLFLTLGLLFAACDIGDSDIGYTFDMVPVSTVDMPADFAKDSITEIPVKYLRPTSCHFFDSFYYVKNGFDRTVAIYCAKVNDMGCQVDGTTELEVPLRFRPTELGTYHFKFFSGENIDGTPQFLEFDAVVDH